MLSLAQRNRNRAAVKQGFRCYYCDFPMWQREPVSFAKKYGIAESETARFHCTAEHLQARQDGGRDDSKNIVAACWFCNRTRHEVERAKSPKNYRKLVRRRVERLEWHPGVSMPFLV